MEQLITHTIIENAYTYPQYRQLLDQLMAAHKTTGANQSAQMVEYANLNLHRMKRLDKTTVVDEALKAELAKLDKNWIWLVLTEGWCGDAAQSVPVLYHIAQLSSRITFRLILRDEHLDIMDAWLTDGGRSIPKLICLDADTLQPLGAWGPRPELLQLLFREMKKTNTPFEALASALHEWYRDDKTRAIQQEILTLIKNWSKSA